VDGSQQDYGMRVYDPRIGKFLSVDPLTPDYPSWSPYPFAMNRPIDGIDLDGLEWTKPNGEGTGPITPEAAAAVGATADGPTTPPAPQKTFMEKAKENLASYKLTHPDFEPPAPSKPGTIQAPNLTHQQQMSLQFGVGVADGLTTEFGGYALTKLAGKGVQVLGQIEVPLYRTFGGEASASGKYYTIINPQLFGKNYAKYAGLPAQNSGAFTIKVSTPLKNIELGSVGLAKPIGNNTGRLVPELKLVSADAVKVVNLRVNAYINPEYIPILPVKIP
jgi:hypothetical protein